MKEARRTGRRERKKRYAQLKGSSSRTLQIPCQQKAARAM